MLTDISNKTASWLVKRGVIQEDEHELYAFAAYCLLFTGVPIILFVVICALMGCGACSLILVCSVLAMRRYTGGYHAKKLSICIFISIGSLIICTLLVQIMDYSLLLVISLIIATMVIWCFSPIDSENYRLTDLKKRKYRKRARITLIIEWLLYLDLLVFGYQKYAMCMAEGVILSAIFVAVCIPKLNHAKD